ncbi:calpain-1 catalytic subunit-like [Sceloporus undulatus]|uniref:calpain-1 catalytic subunit-like n=1 Tax=Sceloporus undulatus TaxID=8520 RepID=UPI001C4BB651|nr:calpain-1 catalytic subunit-like [Sceloporus undulatus]
MQKNWRKGKPDGKDLLHLYLHIYKVPKEVTKESLQLMTATQRKELLSKFKYVNETLEGSRDITGIFQLAPGNYMIIPFTTFYHDGAEFILRIFTETKHECLELDDEISAEEKTLKVEPPQKTGVNRTMDITFQQYARQDKKIGTVEFKEFMNRTYTSGQELQKDAFSLEDCLKIIQHFDGTMVMHVEILCRIDSSQEMLVLYESVGGDQEDIAGPCAGAFLTL